MRTQQIGFKKRCRTADHMFVLKCIIEQYKNNKKTLYICFVDIAKTFDRVWHLGLLYKLQQIGISNTFYTIIKAMYRNIYLQVKVDNYLTPVIQSHRGVRQGDNLPCPALFNIFINDIPEILVNCAPATYNNIPIQCLMYADDLIILSENANGIQSALDKLSQYCDDWKLQINTNETKMMCINKSYPENPIIIRMRRYNM